MKVVGVLAVSIGRRIEADVVTQKITKRRWIRVVMVLTGLRLMGIAGIEGGAFVDVGIAVPERAGNVVGLGGAVPGVGIPTVIHGNTVNEISDRAETVRGFGGGDCGIARDAEERFRVDGKVRENGCVAGVQVPRAHDMAAEAGGAEIDPIAGGVNFLDAAVSG